MAVAFVGRDWQEILGEFDGPIRLVCWLDSTNTNPIAVDQLRVHGADVRQLTKMHAKVYVARGDQSVAIVGSANLSQSALAEDYAVGQVEAAVALREPGRIAKVHEWFEVLWNERAVEITPRDLSAAKRAWDAAHDRKPSDLKPHGKRAMRTEARLLPMNWQPSAKLTALATRVAGEDPAKELKKERQLLTRLDEQGLGPGDLRIVIKELSRWTGHPGAYYPSFDEPFERVRAAFATLFDRALTVTERLERLGPGGSRKIAGFGLTAWATLLSWRYPREYPPFNRRTQRFLADFQLAGDLRTTLSPEQYADWLTFAQELSARLRLRSAGYIDRAVWAYTGELTL